MTFIYAIMLVLGGTSALAQKIPSPSGDYCRDEVHEYLGRKFGLQPSQIKVKRFSGSAWWEITAWTSLCRGEFVFKPRPSSTFECTTAQYGSRTFFIKRVYATGDCLNYLPHDEYP